MKAYARPRREEIIVLLRALTTLCDLSTLPLGAALAWRGSMTLFDGAGVRQERQSGSSDAEERGDMRRPAQASGHTERVRALGWTELAIGLSLLMAPTWRLGAVAALCLALGRAAALAYGHLAKGHALMPADVVRAGLWIVGASLAVAPDTAWWSVMGQRPISALTVLVLAGVASLAASKSRKSERVLTALRRSWFLRWVAVAGSRTKPRRARNANRVSQYGRG